MTRQLRLVALAILVAVFAGLPSMAAAKSWGVDAVNVTAQLVADGSMTVEEERTVVFDGDYSRLFWVLSKKGSDGIELVSVTDDKGTAYKITADGAGVTDRAARVPGTVYLSDSSDSLEVHVFHDAADSTRTFTLTYRVKGAVQRYADCAELYWQFVGDGWEVGARDFTAVITPPRPLDGKNDVKAWAHGPLTGVVDIKPDGAVTLAVKDLPPASFIEARVLYPKAAFAEAPSRDVERRAQVLAEEGESADEANAIREEEASKASARDSASSSAQAWVIGLIVLGGCMASLVFLAAPIAVVAFAVRASRTATPEEDLATLTAQGLTQDEIGQRLQRAGFVHSVAGYERLSGIFWLVLGILQVVGMVTFIGGAWNIYAATTRFRMARSIEARSPGVPAAFRPIGGLVAIALVNLVFGGIVGILFVFFDLWIRDKVLNNPQVFLPDQNARVAQFEMPNNEFEPTR